MRLPRALLVLLIACAAISLIHVQPNPAVSFTSSGAEQTVEVMRREWILGLAGTSLTVAMFVAAIVALHKHRYGTVAVVTAVGSVLAFFYAADIGVSLGINSFHLFVNIGEVLAVTAMGLALVLYVRMGRTRTMPPAVAGATE